MKNNTFKIDLTCFSFRMFNFSIQDLIIDDGILIVTTTDGDVDFLNLQVVEITGDFHQES